MSAPACDYWLRGENGRERCGAPATHYRNTGHGLFYYCATCARTAEQASFGKISLHKVVER